MDDERSSGERDTAAATWKYSLGLIHRKQQRHVGVGFGFGFGVLSLSLGLGLHRHLLRRARATFPDPQRVTPSSTDTTDAFHPHHSSSRCPAITGVTGGVVNHANHGWVVHLVPLEVALRFFQVAFGRVRARSRARSSTIPTDGQVDDRSTRRLRDDERSIPRLALSRARTNARIESMRLAPVRFPIRHGDESGLNKTHMTPVLLVIDELMNQKKKWRRGAPKTMTSPSHARFAFAFAFVDAPCARATHRTKERNDDE